MNSVYFYRDSAAGSALLRAPANMSMVSSLNRVARVGQYVWNHTAEICHGHEDHARCSGELRALHSCGVRRGGTAPQAAEGVARAVWRYHWRSPREAAWQWNADSRSELYCPEDQTEPERARCPAGPAGDQGDPGHRYASAPEAQ